MQRKYRILWLLLVSLLTACTNQGSATVLDLQPYQDPAGIYALPYPVGWSQSRDENNHTVTFESEANALHTLPLYVEIYAIEIDVKADEEAAEVTAAWLEQFLTANLDEDAEVYNSTETKVSRQPAVLLDFAKPLDGGYLTGRIVLVYLPGYAIGIISSGEKANWDAFLPTFRQMLQDFQLFPEA